MRGTSISRGLRRLNVGWTCSQCRHKPAAPSSLAQTPFRRPYGTAGTQPRSRRGVMYFAAAGAATAGSVLAFSDSIKANYEAAERAGRVCSTLVICINDYRTTLNQREKLEDGDERSRVLKACHQRCADRTLKVLEKNGGVFIKLGQHLSAMNYLLPPEWTTTFIPLQDKCPVSSYESIEEMYRRDVGGELLDYFSAFSEEPIGAASLAQVHLATLRETGQRVAVKVQHPELELWAPLDLALTKFTFSTLKRFFPEYDLEWLSSEMEVSLPVELDFRCEADNARRMKEHFSRIPELPLIVPEVVSANKRILVMANESGHRLDDLEFLDSNDIDRDEVAATLAHIFNEMIFGKNAPLHCDPHGGNIAIRKNSSRRSRRRDANFDIILYDHGLYRDIPEELRISYAKMWLAIIDGDVPRMKKYVKEVAGVSDEQFPLFTSAITGRDYRVVSSSILQPKSGDEKQTMSSALQEGLLADLVQLLGQVPRIILLILKTNDLTRSLDESLHTRQGPLRQFMILARYCMRTVFYEQLSEIRKKGSLYWPPNALQAFLAWLGLVRVEVKLDAFELWISAKRVLGLDTNFAGAGMA